MNEPTKKPQANIVAATLTIAVAVLLCLGAVWLKMNVSMPPPNSFSPRVTADGGR